MKNLIKYLLIAFLGICLTGIVFAEWNATIYIDVTKGDDDCSPTGYVGAVKCVILGLGGDSDSQTWTGYGKYTFNLDAPDAGALKGKVDLTDGAEPPQSFCFGVDSYFWGSPPNPAVVNLVVTPVIN